MMWLLSSGKRLQAVDYFLWAVQRFLDEEKIVLSS